ncbi:MAG: transglutaminase [Candidatus Eisenbacteria bacterium]|nr:transglutaminase [Candidatus Eisenbacteria bacterium]
MKTFLHGIVLSIVSVMLAASFSPLPAAAFTGQVSQELPAPCGYATGLAWDGGHLWVSDWKEAKAFKVDPSDGEVLESVELPCARPEDIVYADGCLFVCDATSALIYRLDLATGIVVKSYPAPQSAPSALAWDGENLWVADRGSDTIYKLNPSDGTTLDYFPAPAGDTEGLTWDGKYLWAADRVRDELYMLSSLDGTVIMVVRSPGPYPTGLVFDGKFLWNVDFQNDLLYKLNYDDGEDVYTTDATDRQMTFVHRFTNLGPGVVTTAEVFLAIPEDSIPGQKLLGPVRFQSEPNKFDIDEWGQKVAVYESRDLKPGETKETSYTVRASIGVRRFCIFPDKVGGLGGVPLSIRKAYTADGSRYRIYQPLIAETAKEIVGEEKNPYWIARKICKWVQDHVEYERAGGWDIAETLVKRGTGSCSEYSFLYIALCRAAGLPARYEGSVVVRGDDASMDDVFHRWCEVYLPNYGWIPIDPSGGDSPVPSNQGRAFGMLGNKYFVTTHGGGDSRYLGWDYNYSSRFSYRGKCDVKEEAFALWELAGEASGTSSELSGKACKPK